MSTINTNGIDVNYPKPGVNNSTQGFRDNTTAIKNNLNTAGIEITDLQEKVVVKAGLVGIPINNDMANTLISNAAIRSFRSTTYNLGNSIAGTIVIDATLGDVQYGTITGNTTLQLAGWAPTNTQSKIELDLTIANTEAYIIFPGTVTGSDVIIENNTTVGGNLAITAPYNVTNLQYSLVTTDCGNSVTIEPLNRPYQTSQVEVRNVITPTGYQGDVNGDIALAPKIQPVLVTATTTSSNILTTASTEGFYLGMPIQFYGVVFGNIVAGTIYYVRTIVANTSFTVSASEGGADFALVTASGTMQGAPTVYVYLCVGAFDSSVTTANVYSSDATTDRIEFATTVSNIASYGLNQPIVFTGANITTTGLLTNTAYYIKTVNVGANTEITVSRSRANGIAGTTEELTTVAGGSIASVTGTAYTQGNDIWKRTNLVSF